MSRHERALPGLRGQKVYLAVMLVVAVGLVWAMAQGWRVGLSLVAVGLALGAVARGCLPTSDVGLLAVRGRVVDTIMLTVVALTLAGISFSLG